MRSSIVIVRIALCRSSLTALLVMGLSLQTTSIATAQEPIPTQNMTEADGVDFLVQKVAANRLLEANQADPINERVDKFIDKLASTDTGEAQAAVTALIMLGPDALPQTIRRINDHRNLAIRVIYIDATNAPSFESVAQYGVSEVCDALNHVLVCHTRRNFGLVDLSMDVDLSDPVTKARVDQQRRQIAAAWQNYLETQVISPPVPTKSLPTAGF